MFLFDKKVKIYQVKGRKEEFKQVKAALKQAGIRCVGDIWQDEMPVCGCGAKLDNRDFGSGGKIDRDIYAVRVRVRDEAAATALVHSLFPDYTPYIPKSERKENC